MSAGYAHFITAFIMDFHRDRARDAGRSEGASVMSARLNAHRRLYSETVRITLKVGDGQHVLDVSLAYDRPGGTLREVNFVGRGRIGSGIDMMLHDLGIQLSRAIQHRNPDTGEAVDV